MKIFKSKLVLGVISIALALILVLIISPQWQRALNRKTEVVRFTKDLKSGSKISSGDISLVNVGGLGLQENALRKKEEVLGKYLKHDVVKGETVLLSKISNEEEIRDRYLKELEDGQEAISVSVKALSLGVTGKVQAGDIVSVYTIKDGEDDKSSVNPKPLRYMKVLAVANRTGDKYEADGGSGEEDLLYNIILLSTEVQSKLLAKFEADGHLQFAIVYRGADEKRKEKLLQKQKLLIEVYEDELEEIELKKKSEKEIKDGEEEKEGEGDTDLDSADKTQGKTPEEEADDTE